MSDEKPGWASWLDIPHEERPNALGAPPGLTLRDWFAGQALTGEIASSADDTLDRKIGETPEQALVRDAMRRAKWCYAQADAMLAARALGQEPR